MAGLLQRYKAWAAAHSDLLFAIENGLSCVTWVLPDRFAESELSLELVHTALNLLATFHDSIARQSAAGQAEALGPDLALLLGALEQVTVLVELGAISAEHRGRIGSRYTVIALVEALKALVRLAVLRASGDRLLLHGGHGNRAGPWQDTPSGSNTSTAALHAFSKFRTQRRAAGGAPGSLGEKGKQLQASAEPPLWWDLPSPQALAAHPPSARDAALQALEAQFAAHQAFAARLVVTGEVLHILRPVVHALALRRWGTQTWRPWLLALTLDLASRRLSVEGARASRRWALGGAMDPAARGSSLALLFVLQATRWSSAEKDELFRRRLQLAYYLLRDPLFTRHVGPALARWQAAVGWVPLLGGLSSKAVEILSGFQQYFAYTSAS